jgi:hypothetical protein
MPESKSTPDIRYRYAGLPKPYWRIGVSDDGARRIAEVAHEPVNAR